MKSKSYNRYAKAEAARYAALDSARVKLPKKALRLERMEELEDRLNESDFDPTTRSGKVSCKLARKLSAKGADGKHPINVLLRKQAKKLSRVVRLQCPAPKR